MLSLIRFCLFLPQTPTTSDITKESSNNPQNKTSLVSLEEEDDTELTVINKTISHRYHSTSKSPERESSIVVEKTSKSKKAVKKSDSVESTAIEKRLFDLEQKLAARESEIANLRKQLKESHQTQLSSSSTCILGESSVETAPDDRSIESSAVHHRTVLYKLMEEQKNNSKLRSSNTELKLKVATLEGEVDKLHQQNLFQLQQLEQATSIAIAAKTAQVAASSAAVKSKKKSFFGLRRSGRKSSGGGVKNGNGSSAEQSPQLIRPVLSSSFEGSLSEHDLSGLLTRRNESHSGTSSPRQQSTDNVDIQLLQTSLRLSLEEKVEFERQLESLRDELKQQEDRIEHLLRNTIDKQKMLELTAEVETLQQSVQLLTREKELMKSENEGLTYELESLRAESEILISSLKGKEVKAVLKEKQEMDFLRSENKALMSEVRTLITNSDNLETSLSQLRREMVARDVREHELKLKVKKLDQENVKLKTDLSVASQELNKRKSLERSPLITPSQKPPAATTSRKSSTGQQHKSRDTSPYTSSPERQLLSSSSSYTEQQSPSTGQVTTKTSHQKKPSWPPPVVISESKPTVESLHERTQSEDLSTNTAPLPISRTSSGGTKAMAVQVTLPKKETALKVTGKSSSVPFLSKPSNSTSLKENSTSLKEDLVEKGSDKTSDKGSDKGTRKSSTTESSLGTFRTSISPLSPKPAGVNSLVKMFESGGSMSASNNNNTMTESPVLSEELSESKEENVKFSIAPYELKTDVVTDTPKSRETSSPSRSSTRSSFAGTRPQTSSSLKEESDEDNVVMSHDQKSDEKVQEDTSKKIEEQQEKKRINEDFKSQQKESEKKDHEKKKQKEEEKKEKDDLSDRCQTWPPKHDIIPPVTNTLPSATAKHGDEKRSSPTQRSPLAINKPKPPPSVTIKSQKPLVHQQSTPVIQLEVNKSPTSVANLRSSWEKKSVPNNKSPLVKTFSNPSSPNNKPEQVQTQTISPSQQQHLRPLIKTGSGPSGVLSSPSDAKKVIRSHPPLTKMESTPVTTTPPHQQNGVVQLRPKRLSTADVKKASSLENMIDEAAPANYKTTTNGHTSSPKLYGRPASLYVSGTDTSNDKKLSSLITILQEKETSSRQRSSPTPPAGTTPTKSPIFRQTSNK